MAQNCTLYKDTNLIDSFSNFIDNSILDNYFEKDIVIIYVTFGEGFKNTFVISEDDNNGFDIHCYDRFNKIYNEYKRDENQIIIMAEKIDKLNFGGYKLYSELTNRQSFDGLCIKYHDKKLEIFPIGTSIKDNLICIKQDNLELYDFLQSLFSTLKDCTANNPYK
jgi:hypothetical protein